jgi:hypothetical protein
MSFNCPFVVLLVVIVFSVDSGGCLGFGTLVRGRCPHTKFLVVLLTLRDLWPRTLHVSVQRQNVTQSMRQNECGGFNSKVCAKEKFKVGFFILFLGLTSFA